MKHRDSILDLVRGLSALLVMLGHLRGFIFLDYDEIVGAGVLTKGFYFVTGLGHQAVMVFFVLSGYFLGGSVLTGLAKGSFSWRGYQKRETPAFQLCPRMGVEADRWFFVPRNLGCLKDGSLAWK